jgi:O-acetyl-ADP-ribose deacetylase (regulator of RNase III)
MAVKAVKHYLETENNLDEVVFVLFSDCDLKVYLEAAEEELRKKPHF